MINKMKQEMMDKKSPVNKNDLKELLIETKETVATDVHNRTFGLVDLWSVQKRQRTSLNMRRFMN